MFAMSPVYEISPRGYNAFMVTAFSFTTDAWADTPAISFDAWRAGGAFRYQLSLDGYRSVECEGTASEEEIVRLVGLASAWKPCYFRPVLDDNNWTVEWRDGNRLESRQGNNAFPPDWGQFVELVSKFQNRSEA